jgi:hypothetical protein
MNCGAESREGWIMAEARIGVRIAEDRKSVTLAIAPVGEEGIPIELSLDQLTNFIALLGETRARMLEGLPTGPLEGKSIRTVAEPNWYVQVAQIDGSLIAFDHPAYGPVGFAIPRRDVAKIVRILTAHLTLPEAPAGKQS